VLELFALARFAGRVSLSKEALRLFLALRRMRPDVPEFSSHAAMLMIEAGCYDDAGKVLEEFLASDFDDCSLVHALLAYLFFLSHDPRWVPHARRSVEVAKQDGGGAYQREALAFLPIEALDGF